MASPGIKILTFIVILSVALTALGQSVKDLREGDLLFCCTDTANAITAVTIGGEEGIPYVIEAVKPTVRLTPIDIFLCNNPHVIVGRVNADFFVQPSVRRCLAMVGKPYDDLYLPGDSAIYCSELVQLNYRTVSNRLIFEPVPMSFHDKTGRVTDYWQEFYAQRGMTVPEGAPGTNPSELSRRQEVNIIGKILYSGHDILFHWYR